MRAVPAGHPVVGVIEMYIKTCSDRPEVMA